MYKSYFKRLSLWLFCLHFVSDTFISDCLVTSHGFGTLQQKRQHLSVKPFTKYALGCFGNCKKKQKKTLEFNGNKQYVIFSAKVCRNLGHLVRHKKPGSSLWKCCIASQANLWSLPAEQTGNVTPDDTFWKQLLFFFSTSIFCCIFIDHKARCACFCIQLPKLMRGRKCYGYALAFSSSAFQPFAFNILQ